MTKPTKLNDLQLILLSTASQRDAGNLLPLPESAAADVPRTRKAIEDLLKKRLAAGVETHQLDQVWRDNGDQRLTVVITETGRAALGLGERHGEVPPAGGDGEPGDRPVVAAAEVEVRSRSKKSLLLDLLRREGGASIDELVAATSWLPHTARAAITGVRKAGHDVAKQKVEGVTRYSISGGAAQ